MTRVLAVWALLLAACGSSSPAADDASSSSSTDPTVNVLLKKLCSVGEVPVR